MRVMIKFGKLSFSEPIPADEQSLGGIYRTADLIVRQYPSVNHPDTTVTLVRDNGETDNEESLRSFLSGRTALTQRGIGNGTGLVADSRRGPGLSENV